MIRFDGCLVFPSATARPQHDMSIIAAPAPCAPHSVEDPLGSLPGGSPPGCLALPAGSPTRPGTPASWKGHEANIRLFEKRFKNLGPGACRVDVAADFVRRHTRRPEQWEGVSRTLDGAIVEFQASEGCMERLHGHTKSVVVVAMWNKGCLGRKVGPSLCTIVPSCVCENILSEVWQHVRPYSPENRSVPSP